MTTSIGLMQGRLSPLYDGQIQSFPWDHWQDEFPLAAKLGLTYVAWTLDRARLDENPIMTEAGRRDIARLCDTCGIRVETYPSNRNQSIAVAAWCGFVALYFLRSHDAWSLDRWFQRRRRSSDGQES